MKNNIKSVLALCSLATLLLTSCVNETYDYSVPPCVNPNLVKNKEVTDVYATAIGTPPLVGGVSQTPTYTADDIIEGYVVSSDEGGNFYQKLYVQPTVGGKGFYLSINDPNLYTNKYEPGRKVFLKMKGLAYANPTSFDNGLVFGMKPTDKYAVDRIQNLDTDKFLIPSCDYISEDLIVNKITLNQAFAANNPYLNTLVEIDNVQFENDNATYGANPNDAFDKNENITNGTNFLATRTSKYANFAGHKLPTGKGKIRGVLTKYNSAYQLIIRTERDVKMTNPRVDYAVPLVGNAIVYSGAFTENFESYTPSTNGITFPKYVNDAYVGSRYWDVKTFSSNKYIQMTSFGAGPNKTYLAMPVDFTAANNLVFKTKDGYNNGNVLKVYYTTNYVPGGNFGAATLIDITSNFTIASGTATGYATNFTSSGAYAFPTTLTGNGFIIFEYSGTTSITTTMQIDDITVN